MSVRSFVRASLFATGVVAIAGLAGSASAQALPIPVPTAGTPSPIPIPGAGTGIPGVPGVPGAPGIPGLPGGTTTGAPPIPGLPPFPAPGGTPGVPAIPGLPSNIQLFSPSGALLMPFMKDEAKKLYQKLKDALPANKKSIVDNIPLLSDPSKDDVNAFAGCDDSGKTFVVVTEGLYQMIDLIAQTRATDETFGTDFYDEYIKDLAAQQEGKATILPLPPGALDPTKSLDQRKLQRQRQIFDEEIGYVVGHELGHHYLGHLGSTCGASKGPATAIPDMQNAVRKILPAINQPNEIAADMAGINNLLDMGQNESDYHFGEGGALLVLDFFKKVQDLHPGGVLFTFMSTHPAPEIRSPIVKNTANFWRLTHPGAITGNGPASGGDPTGGTAGLPKFPFPIPGAPTAGK